MTTYVLFIVSGEIKSPHKRSLRLEWYHAVYDSEGNTCITRTRKYLPYANPACLVRFVQIRVVLSFLTVHYIFSVRLFASIVLFCCTAEFLLCRQTLQQERL